MGKRVRGAALRAKKRAREAVEELQERQAEEYASQSVKKKKDEELFVLDTTGHAVPHSQRPPSKEKRRLKKQKQRGLSEKEKQQVQRLLDKHEHSAEKLTALAKEGRRVLERKYVRTRGARSKGKANFDLWDGDGDAAKEEEMKKKGGGGGDGDDDLPKPGVGSCLAGTAPDHTVIKRRGAKKPPSRHDGAVAVDVARCGQSYHPDPKSHGKVLNRAANVELRRDEAERYRDAPISGGMSEETRALLLGDTDSEDESDTDDDDDDSDRDDADDADNDGEDAEEGSAAIPKTKHPALLLKRTEKLTRAQRNKQKRLRKERKELENRKREKKFSKSLSQISHYKREIDKRERERQRLRERAEQAKRDRDSRPLGKDVVTNASETDPTDAPTLPVALSHELKSSLRTVKPKGSLITDRMTSYVDRKMAPKRKKTDDTKKQNKRKKRKLSYKGRKNNETKGDDFAVLG